MATSSGSRARRPRSSRTRTSPARSRSSSGGSLRSRRRPRKQAWPPPLPRIPRAMLPAPSIRSTTSLRPSPRPSGGPSRSGSSGAPFTGRSSSVPTAAIWRSSWPPPKKPRRFLLRGRPRPRREIRPLSFGDFIGQRRAVENLLLAARAAKERGEALGHVVLSGEPGLGKTTLARLLAGEYGAGLVEVLGMKIGDPSQLVSLLCGLPRNGHLYLDEIHCLPEACRESLYPALEDGVVDVVLREGGRTRALRVRLEPFTLVGATTCLGELSKALRDRFRLQERLDPYGEGELAEVVSRAAVRLGTSVTPEAALEVARRARGTPREAIRLLERARDLAQVQAASHITMAHVDHAAERLGIDERGLDRVEREAVKLLAGRTRPLGVKAIAAALGIDLETYERVHEPWLERAGLTERCPEGRIATRKAREIYGRKLSA